MNTKSNSKVEVNGAIKKLFSNLALKVFADEEGADDPILTDPTGGAGSGSGSGIKSVINFEELVKQARQEEKDKLYPQINTLKEKVKVLTESNNEALIKCAEIKQKYEALLAKQENGEETEEVKNLKTQITTLEERINTLEEENNNLKTLAPPNEEELRQKIEAEFTVKNHLAMVKEQNKDTVLSVFIDEIGGDTVEAIDQSLQKAIEKSNSVREQITGNPNPNSTPPVETGAIHQPSINTPPTPPIANPNGDNLPKNFDPEYVRNLQPGTPEYEEFRKSLGLR